MTDRGRAALRQSANRFTVGPSSLTWADGALTIDIDERGAPPMLGRIRGRVTLRPSAVTGVELPLTPDGAHVWRPFAPTCTISVDFDAPGWRWDGHGYFDANFGTRALETDFDRWSWGRFPVASGSTCFYDATRRDGSRMATGVHVEENGAARTIALPPEAALPRSRWALPRLTRADAGYRPTQVLPMLDAPFYCRSAVRTRIDGEETTGVHEALDLRRFASPLLKPMLALRVPRRAGWTF